MSHFGRSASEKEESHARSCAFVVGGSHQQLVGWEPVLALEEREEELEAVVGDKQAKINTEYNCINFPACIDLKVKILI